jgi:hypothetical protein
VRQQLGRREQHRAAPAAQVEHGFVTAKPQSVQDFGPDLELADARVVRTNIVAVVAMAEPVPAVTAAVTR